MNYFQNVYEQNKWLIHVRILKKFKLVRLILIIVSNLKSSQSVLDYHELKRLQEMSNDSDDRYSVRRNMKKYSFYCREEAHHMFMKQYESVLKPQQKRGWISR